MNKPESFIEKHPIVVLVGFLGIYLCSRVLRLGDIPFYMHIDELEAAYESVCMANYGTDSVGNSMPLFFQGLGNGHNALYIYIAAFLIRIRGGLFSISLFRMVSVAVGLMAMVFSYLYMLELTDEKRYALLNCVLVLTLPVYFMSQRTGIEYYMFLELMPAAFYFLAKGIRSASRIMYVISSVLFAMILFSSRAALFIVPLFLAATYVYLLLIRDKHVIRLVWHVVPVSVAFVAVLVSNHSLNVGLNPSKIWPNITGIAHLWYDSHPYNASSSFGTLYLFSIPILIIGCVVSFRKMIPSIKDRKYDTRVVLWIFVFSSLVYTLLSDSYDIPGNSHVFFWVTALICEGLIYISENMKHAYVIEIAAHLAILLVLGQFYYININSEINNSIDHDNGIVVDKSIGDALKETVSVWGDKQVCAITGNYPGRNLIVATYIAASPKEYGMIKDKENFKLGNVELTDVNEGEHRLDEFDDSGNTVYVINEAEHGDISEMLTREGWGAMYMKEYTICYKQ